MLYSFFYPQNRDGKLPRPRSTVRAFTAGHKACAPPILVPTPKPEASGGFQLMFMHEYCGLQRWQTSMGNRS
jgi:hypothetical protein